VVGQDRSSRILKPGLETPRSDLRRLPTSEPTLGKDCVVFGPLL
jgi:hypothetical protein